MVNNKKNDQLGESYGSASHKLRKILLFDLLQNACLLTCYRCSKKIETIDELSIEHKVPWLDSNNPRELFFDISNITYSHLSCNSKAGRKPKRTLFTPEEKRVAQNYYNRVSRKKNYTVEKRRAKYLRTGT